MTDILFSLLHRVSTVMRDAYMYRRSYTEQIHQMENDFNNIL